MTYERTVNAALTETKSKFALAEALAEDIPSRQRGRHGDDITDVSEYIEDARKAILAAGGEPKAARTLTNYRTVALWAKDPVQGHFRWVVGVSFTAHREACGAGMSYEEFARMGTKTTAEVRKATGLAPYGVRHDPDVAISAWTPEQKADAARELLSDPEVAERIAEDITEHVASDNKRTSDVISKRRAAMPQPEPEYDEEPRPKRDYKALTERHVNGLSVVLAAESSGEWTPDEQSQALLYFLAQIIGNRSEPTGDQAQFVNDKLENLFAEVEAFANSEVS